MLEMTERGKVETKEMQRPAFKWEWNINTVAVVVGFASGFIAWGYTLSELQTGRAANAANIQRIDSELRALSQRANTFDNHELRITTLERQVTDSASAMKAIETTIGQLASDMRLTREILERLERSQKEGRP